MDYLDRFDDYKRQHCEELSVKDKLRTGYTNKKQLKRGLSSFVRYVPEAGVIESSKLGDVLFPDVRDKIRIGVKVSSGTDQELAIYDDGVETNSLSERSYSPPLSTVAEEERIGMETNVLIAQYEMGRITADELGDALQAQRGRFQVLEEAPTGEVRVSGMRARDRTAPPMFPPTQPVQTMADLPQESTEEGSYEPPPYVPV